MEPWSNVWPGCGTGNYPDLYGSYNYKSSNNLTGIGVGLSGITDGVRGNLVGTSQSPIDPLLGGLAWNGGPTRTHMAEAGSPVLDAESGLVASAYHDGRLFFANFGRG